MTDKILVLTHCATLEEATRIADALVEARLAACASIGAEVASVYHWRGAVEHAREHPLTLKSRRDLFSRLCEELKRMHSYEVPEILAIPCVDGAPEYLAWMDAELAQPGKAASRAAQPQSKLL